MYLKVVIVKKADDENDVTNLLRKGALSKM